MPAFVHGHVICENCGASAYIAARVAKSMNRTPFYWMLPEDWLLYESPGSHGPVQVFCSAACNAKLSVMGPPTQIGRVPAIAFDARTVATLHELVDAGTRDGVTADTVLNAIEAVLVAWRQRNT